MNTETFLAHFQCFVFAALHCDCLSIHVHQCEKCWMNFHEIWCWGAVLKFVHISILRTDNNNKHFTWRTRSTWTLCAFQKYMIWSFHCDHTEWCLLGQSAMWISSSYSMFWRLSQLHHQEIMWWVLELHIFIPIEYYALCCPSKYQWGKSGWSVITVNVACR
jgi:hypothetical protein